MAEFAIYWKARPALAFAIIACMATALRVLTLVFADADLGPDEAQYWVWSREPAFGYFSKPPLIAWAIAATTGLFGDGEWAVRLSAPFFHFGAAGFIYALAHRLFGSPAALWSGLGWILMPGVSFSAVLMTTDAPLLFFWSAALYGFFAVVHARETVQPAILPAIGLGAAIGLGLLAKYAMLFFIAGGVLAAALAPSVRRNFRLRDAAVAAGVAAVLIAPNLWWNALNDFQTISHTAANAKWGADMFHPLKLLEFLGAQFGVFGPIFALLLLWGAATLGKRLGAEPADRGRQLALLAFAIPPLAIVCVQAFLSRAHANWAGAAYPAAMILVAVWALRAKWGAALQASVALHLAAATIFMLIFADFTLADRLGASNAVKRLRAWETTASEIRAAAAHYDSIVIDDRELMASLLYYLRDGPPIYAWNSNQRIDHHFEAFMAFDPARATRPLFLYQSRDPIALNGQFDTIAAVGALTVDLKRGRTRDLYLFAVEGLRP